MTPIATPDRAPDREVLKLPEAADYLGIRPRTLIRLLKKGVVPGVKVGKAWRIHRDALRGYVMPERAA